MNKVRYFVDEFFSENSLDKKNFNRVFLGISEAVNNSIVHGNCLNEKKRVSIRIVLDENRLIIEVKDEGDGFPVESISDPTFLENLKKENGRGIFLLRQNADDVKYSDGGRNVMIKYNLD